MTTEQIKQRCGNCAYFTNPTVDVQSGLCRGLCRETGLVNSSSNGYKVQNEECPFYVKFQLVRRRIR